jgi:hypothetical protein
MDRYLIISIVVVAMSISGACSMASLKGNNSENKKQIITQEHAAELAAKLANEKFQKDFHRSPFKPESYKAELIDSRWHWGIMDLGGINGCSAKVEFNKDGSEENVEVALYSDKAYLNDARPSIELKEITDPSKDVEKQMQIKSKN